jgi:hypothetical protein
MLSNHDRETLDEIQHRLMVEDPAFTSSFEVKARALGAGGPGRHPRLVATLAMVSLLITAFMIVVEAAGPAFFFTAVDCGLIWWWLSRCPGGQHQSR